MQEIWEMEFSMVGAQRKKPVNVPPKRKFLFALFKHLAEKEMSDPSLRLKK